MRGGSRWARALVAFVVCCLALPVQPASAHFGSHGELPVSNYRTRITSISPGAPGLSVRVIDAGGRLEATWTGEGDLVIDGYEGEPYLKLNDEGVFTNLRSTSTYLNQSRYATDPIPAMADNSATPAWSKVADGDTVRWHDHRAHWMSPQPPPEVLADPDTEHVVFDDWSIPMTAAATSVTVSGDVTWVPPPSPLPWWLAALAVGAVALALLYGRWWRTAAWVIVGVLGAAMVATLVLARSAGASFGFWPVVSRLVVLAAAAALAVSARRQAASPPAPLLVAGLVGLYFGGWRAAGVLSHSQLTVDGPPWLIRALVAVCFGLSAAAIVRVVAFIVGALVRPPGSHARVLSEAPR